MNPSYEDPVHVLALQVRMPDLEPVLERLRDDWDCEPVQVIRPPGAEAWLELYFADEVEARVAAALYHDDSRVQSVWVRRTAGKDWRTAYRAHFSPREIGQRLRIWPAWEKENAPADGRVTLWVDPGLSFGTGEHFTTAFCLEMLDRLWLHSPPGSFLDVGAGSGLLAIAAARLGCPRVVAIEKDAAVVGYARENLLRNGVAEAVDLREADLRDGLPGRFDLVCANLVSGLLIACAAELVQASGRWLAVTGIREAEADGVAGVYAGQGAREVVRDGDGEWVGILFACGESGSGRE